MDMEENQDHAVSETKSATFAAQANALLRKSLVFQRRRWKTNCLICGFPAALCLLLFVLQMIINAENDKPANKCGCACVPLNNTSGCQRVCGVEYSTQTQSLTCAVPSPSALPAMLQIPDGESRAVDLDGTFPGYPDPVCRNDSSCPLLFLYTAQDRSIADVLVSNMLNYTVPSDPSNPLSTLVPGTSEKTLSSYYLDPAFPNNYSILSVNCNAITSIAPCVYTQMLWRDNKQQIERELYMGYRKANREHLSNGIPLAYDFKKTNLQNLDVSIFYNSSFRADVSDEDATLRVARSMNLAANAFIKARLGPSVELPISFIKEMPKPETKLLINFTLLLGPVFFMWVVQLLFPVMLISLVYEKERKLRKMMKMHGLGDAAYWSINYIYFLVLSMVYVVFFIAFGNIVGLDYFRQNAYSLEFVFYFVFSNLQIVLAFFATALFSNTMTATVCGYLYVFGFGLLGSFLFRNYIEDTTISRNVIIGLELFPGFSLYRGLYEFSQYALVGASRGTKGMQWKNLGDSGNGMKQVLVIMAIEWVIFLFLFLLLDQGVTSPLSFFKKDNSTQISSVNEEEEDSYVHRPDVLCEKMVVDHIRPTIDTHYAIICDNLKKVYAGKDGNPDKHAVRGLSLAVRRGECFGMLGPNGAGKTTSINMMIGFASPTSGRAYLAGLDITKDMDKIYTVMGVCPQHDLLWESLTGREHLLFYGRLKNLKAHALELAVQTSLKNVNLFYDGSGDKLAGEYSGGMKRRLSVAISLIGDSKAVYMDEPSTGLDPASRRTLWNAIKRAKEDRAIILTTHSMEEAEALCDRVGIFVNGQLQCIGNVRELKSRYGGYYVFTVTGDPAKEEAVVNLVENWSSNVRRIYNSSGTQKFEISKDVKLATVFKDVDTSAHILGIKAWGLSDTTLEDVFIKVAT